MRSERARRVAFVRWMSGLEAERWRGVSSSARLCSESSHCQLSSRIVCVDNVPKSRVGRSSLGTSTWLGFLYIRSPLSLMEVVTADMM